tara:strand:- start:348 stop:887 length:540 start_codon:yes stop_codon:yes gene_type:complete
MTFIEEYNVPSSLCDKLIKYHQQNKEYKIVGTIGDAEVDLKVKDSTDVLFYNDSTHPTIIAFFNSLKTCIQDYVTKYLWGGHKIHTVTGNLIQHYKKGGGYKKLHYERSNLETARRQLVYMLYCNTLKNGGTEFPLQNTTLQATKGKLIIWPSDFTHPHKGVISHTEEKYIVTGWFEII